MNVRTVGTMPPAQRRSARMATLPTLDRTPPVLSTADSQRPDALAGEAARAWSPSATSSRNRPVAWLGSVLMVLLAVLAFGLLGLAVTAPGLRARRRRRARVCAVCRRNHRRWTAVSVGMASLTLVGAGLWLAHIEPGARRCSVASISGSTSLEDLHLQREATVGSFVHRVLNAPASGLAIAYANWQGYTLCDLRRPLITDVPKEGETNGFTLGDVYVTPPDRDAGETKELARHEVQHSDQWAALTALGGTMLLPLAYLVDDSMYPKSLNHFEQAAGLSDGGYSPAPVRRPGPAPLALGLWTLLAFVVLRTRLRLLFRTVVGRTGWIRPHRCGRHTPGW